VSVGMGALSWVRRLSRRVLDCLRLGCAMITQFKKLPSL
jgi:hypothetical protein